MKLCSKCGQPGEFHVENRNGKRYERPDCKKCVKEAARLWSRRNPARDRARPSHSKSARRAQLLKRLYNLTVEQFEALVERQAGRCAICQTELLTGPGKKLHVDHDHSTGKVRGLLCSECNLGLGKFRDDESRLLAAVEYLRANR